MHDPSHCNLTLAGVVVCGGRGRRMGRDKASLPFGDECLLQRVTRVLSRKADPIVVVAAQQQTLPALPADVIVIRDWLADAGPLHGIAQGLAALARRADAAYVTSCDAPFLNLSFVQALLDRMSDKVDIVAPWHEGRLEPLAAIYRTRLHELAGRLVERNRRRPLDLMKQARTLRVPSEQLRAADADLSTLINLNAPADYLRALRRAGVPLDEQLLKTGFLDAVRPEDQ